MSDPGLAGHFQNTQTHASPSPNKRTKTHACRNRSRQRAKGLVDV